MKVRSIRLHNFRSFEDSNAIYLDMVNVLIGANNSGKTSILRGLHHLQQGLDGIFGDVRVGSTVATIAIELSDIKSIEPWGINTPQTPITFTAKISSSNRRDGGYQIETYSSNNNSYRAVNKLLPNIEPNHFIVPFLSKRKTNSYNENVSEKTVTEMPSNMTNLAAKLSRISNPNFPAYQQYAKACEEILGFVVTAIPSPNGQVPGIYLPDHSTVPIEQMGEGVPNIVYLLTQLAVSKDKLFLVEEPENDLHPHALKALLDLIEVSSKYNQFVISTHSNIVVSHLGVIKNSKLFKVSSVKGQLPTTATIDEVPRSAEERVKILQELGYSFSDYDLWDGWLLLEESSAERIIRDYLIPWFAPKLSRVKTVSAGGVTNVEPAFTDLHRLMLFTHLQPAYAGRAWVRVDGDNSGHGCIQRLREKFTSISKDHFATFEHPQFELYYPDDFKEKADVVLALSDNKSKRKAKKELLYEVIAWIDSDTIRAKQALATSAKSIIDDLQRIQKQLYQN